MGFIINPYRFGGGTLLLDLYPTAAAAFSTRKLRTAYSGSAIRIRRSNDNAEQDIGFSGNDLDQAAITSFVGANSAFVTTWYDQSGNGRNATNTTTSEQPLIVSSGTIQTQNSKPCLNFNNQFLSNTANLINGTDPAISVYSSVKFTSSAASVYGSGSIFEIGSVAAGSFYFPYRKNGTTAEIQFRASAGNSRTYNTGVNFDTALQLLSLNDSGATVTVHKNGSSILSNTSDLNAFSESAGFRIGSVIGAATGRWLGDISEIICWVSDQTSNRAGIESNINTYFVIF